LESLRVSHDNSDRHIIRAKSGNDLNNHCPDPADPHILAMMMIGNYNKRAITREVFGSHQQRARLVCIQEMDRVAGK